jgi:hypothetical protein
MPTTKSAPSETGKVGRGRPTEYRQEYDDLVFRLCLLGAKDTEIAEILGVSEVTLNAWKTQHPDFLKSMTAGKHEADAAIAHSLYHRAKGYSHAAVKILQDKGSPVIVPYTEHYPPDTAAASLWLRNRQPARWRDKVDLEHAGKDGGPIQTQADVTLNAGDAYLRMIGK